MSHPQTTFSLTQFTSPTFISRRRETAYKNTLLYQLNVLKTTGRYDAFKLKWHPSYNDKPDVWPVPNHLFWDSDVAKWIEGVCYFLDSKRAGKGKTEVNGISGEEREIRDAVDELVEMIRGAQQEDGYLNIHFTVVAPGRRWTNLRDLHELYNAGHLIEAALAHNHYYSNDELLEPILKYVDLLCKTFGPAQDQKHGYPGHPEIELALMRLYEKTQDPKHIALAEYFLDERGNSKGMGGRHYYDVEAEARGERENERPMYYPKVMCYWYQQAHEPIIDQQRVEGHSVRAMYLLTGLADLVRCESPSNTKSEVRTQALKRLWSNMTDKNMYLTGGIGAIRQWEGFGIDYFLPSGTDEGGCYAETCASIGVMMLAERLLQIDLDGKYADIMELNFYNAVMTGMSASGKQFTYVNQLASSDSDLSKRAEWFTCACCPPNVTRLLGYIGGYLWTSQVNDNENAVNVNIHMYSSAVLSVNVRGLVVEVEQMTNWPWGGKIDFEIRSPDEIETTVHLRIPGWVKTWQLSPPLHIIEVSKGYLVFPPSYIHANPNFSLNIPLTPRFISPHPYTNQDIIALARGPIVYCVEDADNPWVEDHFKTLALDPACEISEELVDSEKVGEPYVQLTAHKAISQVLVSGSGPGLELGSVESKNLDVEKLVFVPYALRANRVGKGHMRVGIRRKR